MQAYLGSLYVNDFNLFGRTYQVNVQADAQYRQDIGDITQFKIRNAQGEMIPLGSFLDVQHSAGPDRVMHYNGYVTAEINGAPAPGYSSDQAKDLREKFKNEAYKHFSNPALFKSRCIINDDMDICVEFKPVHQHRQ